MHANNWWWTNKMASFGLKRFAMECGNSRSHFRIVSTVSFAPLKIPTLRKRVECLTKITSIISIDLYIWKINYLIQISVVYTYIRSLITQTHIFVVFWVDFNGFYLCSTFNPMGSTFDNAIPFRHTRQPIYPIRNHTHPHAPSSICSREKLSPTPGFPTLSSFFPGQENQTKVITFYSNDGLALHIFARGCSKMGKV